MNKNLKIERLIYLLEKAEIIAGNFSGEYLHHYHSPKEFKDEIRLSITNLKNNDFEELNDIYNSFQKDSEWYDLTKIAGEEIGNNIFSLTTELINEFESGNILELIKDFTSTVNKGVQIIKTKYGVSDLLKGWHSGLYEQTGKLKDLGIEFYAFHGCGLALHFRNKKVDFDFAYVPEQRHDGFDLWRLHGFAQGQPKKYNKYLDKNNLEKDFKGLLKKEIICLPSQDNSPEQYFLTSEIRKTLEMKNTNR
ncbi:DUF6896 domain-containing protein [Algibacter sp. L1A34]|uniref:DUF6896 domain-containing protein n=1 Tax=Algibacter sp. L1A34 TaxID=2686365 RepID=UPI00131EBCE3|nr:hypothetical protein [Algibacter sp. L1A34]